MDTQTLFQAIASVGFPIVCCIVMMYYVKYMQDANREETEKLNNLHRQEMTEITQAIHNNTLAIQKLVDLLNAGEKIA